jgi:hypothetical protein
MSLDNTNFEDIVVTLESYFDFAWRMKQEDCEVELFNLNKLSRYLDKPFETYMTEREYYTMDKLYQYICKIDFNEIVSQKRVHSDSDLDMNEKCKYIYSVYKKVLKGCNATNLKYLKILQFPSILLLEHEEFNRIIHSNTITIKSMIREYMPNVNISIKIGVHGPGVYIYMLQEDSSDEQIKSLYKYLDTFYFGKIIKKYILITRRF